MNGNIHVADFGCGYGAFWDFIMSKSFMNASQYIGYDMSRDMINEARSRILDSRATFVRAFHVTNPTDYCFISGTFNMNLDCDKQDWTAYIYDSLLQAWSKCRHGLAFNLLSKKKSEDLRGLFYADPDLFFKFCKLRMSENTELIEDYPAADFTILIHR